MTTKEAINAIHAPKGVTSVLAGLMSSDFSVIPHQKGNESDLEKAKAELAKQREVLKNCKSDWAYWSILGDVSYWEAVCNILEAGELVGHENLPYVSAPDMDGGMVMDLIGRVERFGREVLQKAKQQHSADA